MPERELSIAVFEVSLHQKTNDLRATVQVISPTASSAKRMVLRTFFKKGWEVTDCKVIRSL